MKATLPWLAYAATFALIAYLPVLTGLIDHLPLGVPFCAACATALCLLGALGSWAKGGEHAGG